MSYFYWPCHFQTHLSLFSLSTCMKRTLFDVIRNAIVLLFQSFYEASEEVREYIFLNGVELERAKVLFFQAAKEFPSEAAINFDREINRNKMVPSNWVFLNVDIQVHDVIGETSRENLALSSFLCLFRFRLGCLKKA